jgi:hypothetical protein
VQPGHALWLDDAAQHLVLSCFGSDALAVSAPDRVTSDLESKKRLCSRLGPTLATDRSTDHEGFNMTHLVSRIARCVAIAVVLAACGASSPAPAAD